MPKGEAGPELEPDGLVLRNMLHTVGSTVRKSTGRLMLHRRSPREMGTHAIPDLSTATQPGKPSKDQSNWYQAMYKP